MTAVVVCCSKCRKPLAVLSGIALVDERRRNPWFMDDTDRALVEAVRRAHEQLTRRCATRYHGGEAIVAVKVHRHVVARSSVATEVLRRDAGPAYRPAGCICPSIAIGHVEECPLRGP